MTEREDEELSSKVLVSFLKERGYCVHRLPVPKDPPDLCYDLSLNSGPTLRWGVEVTALTQYIDWNGKEVERRMFEPALHQLVEGINSQHRETMVGSYALFITGPLEKRIFNGLERRILAYIQSAGRNEVALDGPEVEKSILTDLGFNDLGMDIGDPLIQGVLQQMAPQRHRVLIKGSDDGNGLWLMSGVKGTDKLPNDSGYLADIQASVDYGVSRILADKLPKLAPLTGYDRKHLLVWSDLPLGHPEEARKAFARQDLVSSCLDGVFFIDYGWKSLTPLWTRTSLP